jgi:translocon-associated protein subunit alpha
MFRKFLSLLFFFLFVSYGLTQIETHFEEELVEPEEATEGEEVDPDYESVEESSPDISVDCVFPKPAKNKDDAKEPTRPTFVSGEEAEILIGVTNKGKQSYNITTLTASLRHPLEFSIHVQNYTKGEYFLVVKPGETASLSYYFYPEVFEPRDFGFTANLHYLSEDLRNHTTTVFNGTISLIEPESQLDARSFFTYLGVLALLILAAYIVQRFYLSWKKKSKRRVEYGTSRQKFEEADDEWLAGTAVRGFGKGSSTKSKQKKNKQH